MWFCILVDMPVDEKKPLPNLYLVGFMGVGKSVLGRRVARALGFGFLDSDKVIEQEEGRKIADIFATDGETAFRALERRFIEQGHPPHGTVVACGGGLAIQPGMPELLKSRGVVICLFASLEKIIERTSRNKKRPLLDVDDPEERVRQLLAEREPAYLRCGPCITTEGRTMAEAVRHLVRTYRSQLRPATDGAKKR